MSDTYRGEPDYAHTASREKAEAEGHPVPEWAEDFDIGDSIWAESEELDRPHEFEVVGFSTSYGVGYPVIEAPHHLISGHIRTDTVVIMEDSWVPERDVDTGTDGERGGSGV